MTVVEDTQAEKYRRELGDDALDRQIRLALDRYVCCGEPRGNGHHDHCPYHKPVIHPDQESLC